MTHTQSEKNLGLDCAQVPKWDNMVAVSHQLWTYALLSADTVRVTTGSQKARLKLHYIRMIRIPQHPKNGTNIQWHMPQSINIFRENRILLQFKCQKSQRT